MILNSRPLTYISPDDLDEPITPSHLMTGRHLLSLPDHLCYSDDEEFRPDSSRLTVNRRLRHLSNILNHFWTRWKKEYLTELRETHRRARSGEGDLISVGDVVTIHDDAPRGLWRLGLIEEKIKGRDGHVRGALVRVKSGSGLSAFLRRPIQRLFPLEIHAETTRNLSDVDHEKSSESTSEAVPVEDTGINNCSEEDSPVKVPDVTPGVTTRPCRLAAVEARDKIVARLMD